PTSLLHLFGLLPCSVPDLGILSMLSIGVWPILMGISMYAQQLLNPQPPDPMQARIFMMLPVVFTFVLGSFPAGLVIYWTWNNLLSVLQQYVIMRRAGVPIGSNATPAPATATSRGGKSPNAPPPAAPAAPANTSGSGSGKRRRRAKGKN